MKIKNSEISGLADFLANEKLGGKASRMRTKFLKLLNEAINEIESFRKELLEKYSKKDDEGNALIENNSYVLEDAEAFNKEYVELMSENFIIDETESKREMLQHIKRILDNTETEFEGVKAFQYDSWCEAFENLKYEDKSKSPE